MRRCRCTYHLRITFKYVSTQQFISGVRRDIVIAVPLCAKFKLSQSTTPNLHNPHIPFNVMRVWESSHTVEVHFHPLSYVGCRIHRTFITDTDRVLSCLWKSDSICMIEVIYFELFSTHDALAIIKLFFTHDSGKMLRNNCTQRLIGKRKLYTSPSTALST